MPLQNVAGLFIEHLLLNYENSFNVSIKLTMICDYLKSKSDIKSEFFSFYSKLFGIFKYEIISNDSFLWLISVRKKLQNIMSYFNF